MQACATPLWRLIRDENGATAIEYGLIAAFMGVALVPIMFAFSTDVTAGYTQIAGLFALV